MKPYVSVILEHDGKAHTLPIPAKYRELLDCVRALGLKDGDDEDDMWLVGYKALYVPEPDIYCPRYEVEKTATELSKLTEAQVCAIGVLCRAFALPFGDIMGILAYIYPHLKEDCDNED